MGFLKQQKGIIPNFYNNNCTILQEPTLYTIKGMAILDNDGNRILAKYYDDNIFPTVKEQKAFEKNLFNRTHRANAEIIMLDGLTCLYRSNVDLFFYVMGSSQENEVHDTFITSLLLVMFLLHYISDIFYLLNTCFSLLGNHNLN